MCRFRAGLVACFFLFAILLPSVLWAASSRVISLQQDVAQLNVSPYIDYVSQYSQSYTIEDIIEDQFSPHINWKEHKKDVPGFGFDTNTFWFRLQLRNDSNQAVERLFEIKNPVLDDVQFFQVDHQGSIVREIQTGDKNPISKRPFYHHNLIVPFSLPPNQHHYLYFRVTTSGAMEFPIIMWSEKGFQKRDQINLLLFGGLFGIMLVMSMYNFFIYSLFNEISMVFYSGFSVCLMLFLAAMHGFTAQYLWPEQEWLRENFLLLIIPLTVFFAMMFANAFLQMESSFPALRKLILLMAYLNLGLVFLAPFASYSDLIRLSAGMVVPYSIAGILLGLMRWWQGYRPARYFVLAWTAFFLALSYYSLAKFGVVQPTLLSDFSLQIGAVSEAVLFAFALADRMDMQRRSYLRGQRAAFAAQKAANEELELSVTQRTRELRSAMEKLEQANSQLQTLTMQDGLTGIRNRRYFDAKLEQEWHRAQRNKEPVALLMIDIDFFKAFNDKYGHLAGDECLRMAAKLIEKTLTRPSDSVARYGGEEFVVILPETSLSGAVHVAESIRAAFTDSFMVVEGETIYVTVSIGVASLTPTQEQDPQSIIAVTDQCLYKAKSAGRNCVKTTEDQL